MIGTGEIIVRDALVDLLTAALGATAAVRYEAPVRALDLQNAAGDCDAVWTAPGEQTVLDIPTFTGGPVHIDEDVEVIVAVQVMRNDGTDQRTIDNRANAILGQVIAALAADPTLGVPVDHPDAQVFHVVADRQRTFAGLVAEGDWSALARRFELTVTAKVRFPLGGT